jgi:hypothetical protein
MGPLAPGGGWGEPRRSGYEDNWARFGQTTDQAIASGQHTGAAQGAARRGVSHVVVWIGGNDFSPWSGAYDAIYSETWSAGQIDAWLSSRAANLRTIVDALVDEGVRPIVAGPMDFSAMPFVAAGHPDAAGRERVATALAELGERARALARSHRAPYLDLFALNRALFGTNLAPRASLLVGNVAIDLDAVAATTGTNAAWVSDAIHPHEVIQGIWANAVIAALDTAQHGCLVPFSESEILEHAGLAYGGADTLAGEIGPLHRFVTRGEDGGSLRFEGHGVSAPELDRVTFAIDAPQRPGDVGAADFTLELWLRAAPGSNPAAGPCTAASDAWITGNIVVDRDVFGPGDHGDFGISLQAGRVAFGVHNGAQGATLCGATDVRDGAWHHLAVTRRRSAGDGRPAGELRLFLDGLEDAAPLDGPDGDLSYRDGRPGSAWDPFLVLGAEKHDAGAEYPSFTGWIDDLRLTGGLRYAAPFLPPAVPLAREPATVLLARLDEAGGERVHDHARAPGGPTDGVRRFGGAAPAGPAWSRESAAAEALFDDSFECGNPTSWSSAEP